MLPDGALLEAREINCWRGDRHILRDVSFGVRAGEFLKLTGPNGVGKTTLIRIVCGLLPPENGTVLWRGKRVSSSNDEYHIEMAYLGHLNSLKADLTARENLRFLAGLRNTLTDASGRYRFADVPTGNYHVAVAYTGLDEARQAIRLEAATAKLDFDLTAPIYQLHPYTVVGLFAHLRLVRPDAAEDSDTDARVGRHGGQAITTLGAGQCVGEMSVIEGLPPSAKVVTHTACTVVAIGLRAIQGRRLSGTSVRG